MSQHSSMWSLFTAGWTRERWQATWSIGRADGPTWLDENMVGWQPQLHFTPDAFRLQVFNKPSCEWGTWQGRRQTTCHWVAVDSRVTLARRPEDLGCISWRRRHGYLDCHRNYGFGCPDQEHATGPHYPRLEGVHLSCTEEALESIFFTSIMWSLKNRFSVSLTCLMYILYSQVITCPRWHLALGPLSHTTLLW